MKTPLGLDSWHVRALVVGIDDLTQMHRRVMVDLAAEYRFTTIYASREFVDADGLMTYGVSYPRSPATLPSSNPPSSSWSSTVRPEKADVFSGSQPRRGKSQSPVTRVAGWRETKTLKPTDQALGRRVSESPGRNGSERTGGPERPKLRRPSLTVERRRQHGPLHLADAAGHSGGVRATAR